MTENRLRVSLGQTRMTTERWASERHAAVFNADADWIIEQNNPHDFFNHPQTDRSRDFLAKILGH